MIRRNLTSFLMFSELLITPTESWSFALLFLKKIFKMRDIAEIITPAIIIFIATMKYSPAENIKIINPATTMS